MGDKVIHTFPKRINPKVKVTERVDFELAHSKAAVQQISYNAMHPSTL